MRGGRRLAVDVGTVRIGIAVCDFDCIIASGLTTLTREQDLNKTVTSLIEIMSEIDPLEIYIGLPASLSGRFTESTKDSIAFAKLLASETEIPVRLIDERLTSVSANSQLRASGRNAKNSRHVVDQVAATIILEQALAIERSSGKLPGMSIEELDESN